MELFRVLLEKLVRHLRYGMLSLKRLLGVRETEGDEHLALPQRDGVDDGRLDLFAHNAVVVLNESDLRRHLYRYHTGKLKIVDLLLESVAEGCKVVRLLRVLGKTRFLGVLLKLDERGLSLLLKLLLAGENVH